MTDSLLLRDPILCGGEVYQQIHMNGHPLGKNHQSLFREALGHSTQKYLNDSLSDSLLEEARAFATRAKVTLDRSYKPIDALADIDEAYRICIFVATYGNDDASYDAEALRIQGDIVLAFHASSLGNHMWSQHLMDYNITSACLHASVTSHDYTNITNGLLPIDVLRIDEFQKHLVRISSSMDVLKDVGPEYRIIPRIPAPLSLTWRKEVAIEDEEYELARKIDNEIKRMNIESKRMQPDLQWLGAMLMTQVMPQKSNCKVKPRNILINPSAATEDSLYFSSYDFNEFIVSPRLHAAVLGVVHHPSYVARFSRTNTRIHVDSIGDVRTNYLFHSAKRSA
jgi:hypothetical protein